jgi:hypothetical protein
LVGDGEDVLLFVPRALCGRLARAARCGRAAIAGCAGAFAVGKAIPEVVVRCAVGAVVISICVVAQPTSSPCRNGSTQTRPSAYFAGANVVLQNITLRNTGARAAVGHAEALYFAGGPAFTLAAFNSSFYSNQDTIETTGRNWFFDCYVEGNVDFLWGSADAALFENCDLRFVNDVGGAAVSYSLFVARTGTTIAPAANGTVCCSLFASGAPPPRGRNA